METRSEGTGWVLERIKKQGRTEKEGIYTWREIKERLADGLEEDEEWADVVDDLEQMSKVVYRWLRLLSEGEAKAVVMSEESSGDGLKLGGAAARGMEHENVRAFDESAAGGNVPKDG